MSDQRTVTAWHTCQPCGKHAYGSRKQAKQHARKLCRTYLYPYRCPADPAYWHLGHQPYTIARGLQPRSEFGARSRP